MTAFLSHRWRGIALGLLCGWAALLSIEVLLRRPGFAPERGLPDRLLRQGIGHLRAPARPAAAPLPDRVVVLEAADYGPILLRRLALDTSGRGVHLPLEALGPVLAGPGGTGRCVVLDPDGRILAEQTSATAWRDWIEAQPVPLADRLAWLAGLRPYRANTCLWESLP